jgi:hypothetical protein
MAFTRTAISDFAVNNPVYSNATVTAFVADDDGQATATLATFYENPTGPATLQNPQTLDNFGKWLRPVYYDQDIVLSVQPNGSPSHIVGLLQRNEAASFNREWFIADPGQTTYVLTLADCFTDAGIRVEADGVSQEPTFSYTVSATDFRTTTFSTPFIGGERVFIIHQATPAILRVPGAGTVTAESITNDPAEQGAIATKLGVASFFPNVAALRAAPAPYGTRTIAFVAGYWDLGDGGDQWVMWNEDSMSDDNGATYYNPTGNVSGGRWVHIDEPTGFNVKCGGLRADGTTDNLARWNVVLGLGKPLVVPQGNFKHVGQCNLPDGTRIENKGRIMGLMQMNGDPVDYDPTSVVILPGSTFPTVTYPAGLTTLNGDFSGYSPGQMMMMQLVGNGGDGTNNQQGRDFALVNTASGSAITFDYPTRWVYDTAQVKRVQGYVVTGQPLTFETNTVMGDFTSKFAVGTLIRFENRTGTDTFDSRTAYWEHNRVREIYGAGAPGGARIVLENPMAYSYGDFVMLKVRAVNDIQIEGGYVDSIVVIAAIKTRFTNIETRLFNYGWAYDFRVHDIRAISDQPRGFGFTWCRDGAVSLCVSSDAVGVTDNAAFKTLSNISCTFSTCVAYNTKSNDSVQAIYPILCDAFFTPYLGYNQDCWYIGCVGGRCIGGSMRSGWFEFMRGGGVQGFSGAEDVLFERNFHVEFSNITARRLLELKDGIGCQLNNFTCQFLNITGAPRSIVGPGVVGGANGANSGRSVWIRGSTNPVTPRSDGLIVHGVRVNNTMSGETSFYVQSSSDVFLDGISDRVKAGGAKSVELGGDTPGLEIGASCNLKNIVDTPTEGAYSPILQGATTAGAGTYGLTYGLKQRAGRSMLISVVLNVTAHTGTGSMQMTLPATFVPKLSPSAAQMLPCEIDGFALTGVAFFARLDPGSTLATIYQVPAGGTAAPIPFSAAAYPFTLRVNGHFELS